MQEDSNHAKQAFTRQGMQHNSHHNIDTARTSLRFEWYAALCRCDARVSAAMVLQRHDSPQLGCWMEVAPVQVWTYL